MTEKQIQQGRQFFCDCFKEFEWLDDTTFIIPSGLYEAYCRKNGLHQEIRDVKTWEFLMECFGKSAFEAAVKLAEEERA